MAEYKAIETEFDGYRFRSRLEARWALFFDEMRIKYQYECDGFVGCGGTMYLPDFYFPDYDVYGEVKGTDKDLFECQEKISGAIDFNSTPVSKGLLLFGPIPYPSNSAINRYQIDGDRLCWNEGVDLLGFKIQSLNEYGRFVFTSGSRLDSSGWPYIPASTTINMRVEDCSDSPSLLHDSLHTARSARFDHGEHGYKEAETGTDWGYPGVPII